MTAPSIPVDARVKDWPRRVATAVNRLNNLVSSAGISATWGSITGTLSAQTDLNTALSGKQATLVSGTNIKTVNSTTLLGSGNLAVGTVTSVAATVPTGFAIAGSPITSSGTLAITFTAGYSLPTDAVQANWTTAFGWGDHSAAGYLTTAAAAAAYQPLDTQLTSLAGLSYTGNALKVVRVNAGETGFELATGGGGAYTDEEAQDAVGAMVDASLVYVDATPLLQRAALTGDVTAAAGSNATTIANDAVSYAKMQNISATSRVLGRKTAGSGDTEECTLSEVLDFIGSAAQGDVLYRGASGWARLGAGTVGQLLKTGGASANPSWAGPGLNPPVWSSFATALNTAVGYVTLTDAAEGMLMTVGVGGAGTVLRCRLKALPSTPYTIIFKLKLYGASNSSDGCGLFIRDSSGGRMIKFGKQFNTTGNAYIIERWTSDTAFSSTTLTGTAANDGTWFKFTDDGTDFKYYIGLTKETWALVLTEGRTAWIAAPDQIGFGVEDQNITDYFMLIEHFEQS